MAEEIINTPETEETVVKTEVKPRRRRSRFRGYLACCSFIFVLILAIAIVVGILTTAGYTKRWVCDAVVEDSYVWDQAGCKSDVATQLLDNQADISQDVKDLLESGDPEDRIAAIVKLTQPSVVGVGIEGSTTSEGGILGTGFVIDDGYVVTNQHVVSRQNVDYFIQVNNEGQDILDVTNIYRDPANDIAILEIANPDAIRALSLGDSSNLQIGETVIAIGNPLGELSGTVTKGIISGLDRTVQLGSGGFFNSTVDTFENVIQTDAAINPGNSGGPLIDDEGNVIGVNFATVGGADNLSFALPINIVKARLAELEEFGEFRMPFLGVEYRTRMIFMDRQSIIAAQVVDVVSGSPAADAGIKVGDFIIGYDGSDFSDKSLSTYIQDTEIGKEVTLNVLRDNEITDIKVKIGTRNQG